jgi:hypothetical protein
MASSMLLNALSITNGYLIQNYSKSELTVIREEIKKVLGKNDYSVTAYKEMYSYEEVQEILSNINEKEDIRKAKGVYYTPTDIVKFILFNSVKMVCGKLKPNNLHVLDLNGIPYSSFCYEKTVYDPTCGAGVFLLAALEMKLDLLDLHHTEVTKGKIKKVVSTLKGNDLNPDSITITKIRLLLCVLHRHGTSKIKGLAEVMESCFESYDFVSTTPDESVKYDIIIGNPPYVEDSKSEATPTIKYGNIYANVLDNSAQHLKKGGVMGFIIPLSYVSTPRMKKIRDELSLQTAEQYILSYSDRPDCLFASVHQKLCVLFGRNIESERNIYTGNYRYWYKEERSELFNTTEVVKNMFAQDDFIPKLGTRVDSEVYKKTVKHRTDLIKLLDNDDVPIYLNMRAAFWIKAFLTQHNGSEYKEFKCQNQDYANFCMCLLNSSLFWWYWICVSDCWHITRKELIGFKVPDINDFQTTNRLASDLEMRLEDTKVYVGTKQTDYEYKHKECVDVIHEIDDYVNALYGLTDEESIYIKNFSYRYRIGGGVENGRN